MVVLLTIIYSFIIFKKRAERSVSKLNFTALLRFYKRNGTTVFIILPCFYILEVIMHCQANQRHATVQVQNS